MRYNSDTKLLDFRFSAFSSPSQSITVPLGVPRRFSGVRIGARRTPSRELKIDANGWNSVIPAQARCLARCLPRAIAKESSSPVRGLDPSGVSWIQRGEVMSKRQHKSAVPTASIPAEPATTVASIAIANNDGQYGKVFEEAVRVNAYYKWELAGKPQGDGVRFWLEAENDLKSKK
jgi:hypothetical protein